MANAAEAGVSTPRAGATSGHGERCVAPDAARIAADIGTAALKLAKQANGAGLKTVGYLLESAALEAGAEAASRTGQPVPPSGECRCPKAGAAALTALRLR